MTVLIDANAVRNALHNLPADAKATAIAAAANAVVPTVLDVRWRLGGPPGRNDYNAGHIPGAVFVDLDTDLSGPPGADGRHPLPDPVTLERALRAAGVSQGGTVIVYDGGDGLAAARAWWTLRWAGLRDVRVLDGGYPAWVASGYPVDTSGPANTTPANITPGDVSVAGGGMPVLDAEGAAKFSEHGVLLDARQPPRYRGEVEPIDSIAGHIPGAINLPYADLIEPDGRFRSADEMRARFAASGTSRGTAIAAYCGSGVTAAHTVLALNVAGLGDAALYVGSWSNWITDPSRPIATGEQP